MASNDPKFAKNEHPYPLEHEHVREQTGGGYPRSYFYQHNSKAEAKEAAKRGKKHSEPEHHATTMKGPAHFHPVNEKGEIIKDGTHYCYG